MISRWKWIIAACAVAGAFVNGHLLTKWYYQRELSALAARAAQMEQEAVTRQREAERERAETVRQAEVDSDRVRAEIDNTYRLVLTDADDRWVQFSVSSDFPALPASAAAPAEAGQAPANRRLVTRCRRVEKLLVDMARERDLCAAQYNELLRIYKGLETDEEK